MIIFIKYDVSVLNMGIGFTSETKVAPKAELQTVEQVRELIKSEINTCEHFEQQIMIELKEIRHIKHNFQVIKSQLDSIRRLAKEREQLIERLLKEQGKRITMIDLDICRKLFEMIGVIDSELRPMLNKIFRELPVLLVDDMHIIYKESEENRKEMDKINEEGRELMAEIRLIAQKIDSSADMLNEVVEKLNKISEDRHLSERGHSRPIGFKTE